jgi:hypothetical protein
MPLDGDPSSEELAGRRERLDWRGVIAGNERFMAVPPRQITKEHYGRLLRPPTPQVSEYNDDDVLTEYIWRHYSRLLTPAEARAGLYSEPLDREAAKRIKGEKFADSLDEIHGPVTTSELQFQLREGRVALFRRARDRILKDHASVVSINRCPECGRIVRSPGANQCLWCKHDWH